MNPEAMTAVLNGNPGEIPDTSLIDPALVIDLNGTLVRTDLLYESFFTSATMGLHTTIGPCSILCVAEKQISKPFSPNPGHALCQEMTVDGPASSSIRAIVKNLYDSTSPRGLWARQSYSSRELNSPKCSHNP
jgi:hypothetical protein